MKIMGAELSLAAVLAICFSVTPVQVAAQTGCLDARNYYQVANDPTPEKEDFGFVLNQLLLLQSRPRLREVIVWTLPLLSHQEALVGTEQINISTRLLIPTLA